MAAAGYVIPRETFEGSFADDLIKMSQAHYARQGARVTKAVKIAHMGRAMAHQDPIEKLATLIVDNDLTPEEYWMLKEAISSAGVKGFLGGIGKFFGKGGGGQKAVQNVAGRVRSGMSNIKMPKFLQGKTQFNKMPGGMPNVRGGGGVSRGARDFPIAKPSASPSAAGAVNVRPKPAAPTPKPPTRVDMPAAQPQAPKQQIPKTMEMPTAGPLAPSKSPGQLVGPQMRQDPIKSPIFTQPQPTPAGRVSTGGGAPTPTGKAPTGGAPPTPQAGAPAAEKPGFLKRVFGGGKRQAGNIFSGATGGELAEGAGMLDKALYHGSGVAASMTPLGAPTAGKAVAGMVAAPLIGKAVQVGKKLITGGGGAEKAMRSAMKSTVKQVGKQSTKAVGSLDDVAGLGLRQFDDAAMSAAASRGMSPKQLHAIDNLAAIANSGTDMPKGMVRKLERAAGVSLDDVGKGGVGGAIQNASVYNQGSTASSLKKLKETKDVVSDAAEQLQGDEAPGMAGRVKNFLTQPLGGPKTRLALGAAGLALPVAGGLGLYGAYHGMNQLAAANQGSQYQHGAYGMPINYSQTSMFPAGQIMY